MAYSAKLRSGSFIILGLGFCGWVLALGGLGAQNWCVCKGWTAVFRTTAASINAGINHFDIAAEAAAGTNIPESGPLAMAVGNAVGKDVAFCSRSWKWEWWTLFLTLAVYASAVVVTALPSRLPRARFPLANLLSISSVLIMVALNEDITAVWGFYDEKKMFDQWQGVLRKLYMSAAALVAGWIIAVVMNLIWIGFSLDTEANAEGAAPITDPEAARKN